MSSAGSCSGSLQVARCSGIGTQPCRRLYIVAPGTSSEQAWQVPTYCCTNPVTRAHVCHVKGAPAPPQAAHRADVPPNQGHPEPGRKSTTHTGIHAIGYLLGCGAASLETCAAEEPRGTLQQADQHQNPWLWERDLLAPRGGTARCAGWLLPSSSSPGASH
jgi:hypothetical protein